MVVLCRYCKYCKYCDVLGHGGILEEGACSCGKKIKWGALVEFS